MKKIIFFLLIGILIFATTLTKNSTKKIDKKIFETKENMVFFKNKYELVLLDYNYLSSPKKLMNYQNEYFENYLIPKKIDKINEIIFDENTSKIQIIDKNLNE